MLNHSRALNIIVISATILNFYFSKSISTKIITHYIKNGKCVKYFYAHNWEMWIRFVFLIVNEIKKEIANKVFENRNPYS